MVTKILRQKTTWKLRGRSRAAHYSDIEKGLFPPAIAIGERAVGYPEYEVEAIISAQISGKTQDDIRELVKKLIADRKNKSFE